jgi:hypothetical protein
VLASARTLALAPVAGVPIVHELFDGIEIERRDAVAWTGTSTASAPLVIRHELGDARPLGMHSVLTVPPWCTFYLDDAGEPASLFHAVFGEVDRLLACVEPGHTYAVRYASTPTEPVVALQAELTSVSFALSARGNGLIAHSCAFVAPDGGGVLCPGISGTGKTTLARLLADMDVGVELLTDDRAIVTLEGDELGLWGSPWPGAARIAGSGHAPLSTVVFIRHGSSCGARTVSPRDAFRRIVNTLSMPLWEPARCGSALEIVDALVSRTRLVEIAFPPTKAGARWALDVVQQAVTLGTVNAR